MANFNVQQCKVYKDGKRQYGDKWFLAADQMENVLAARDQFLQDTTIGKNALLGYIFVRFGLTEVFSGDGYDFALNQPHKFPLITSNANTPEGSPTDLPLDLICLENTLNREAQSVEPACANGVNVNEFFCRADFES